MSDKYRAIGTPIQCLVEECAEVIQCSMKGERFGWNEHHPNRDTDNRQDLQLELLDLERAIRNVREFLDL